MKTSFWYGIFVGKELWATHEFMGEAKEHADRILSTDPVTVKRISIRYSYGKDIEPPLE